MAFLSGNAKEEEGWLDEIFHRNFTLGVWVWREVGLVRGQKVRKLWLSCQETQKRSSKMKFLIGISGFGRRVV